MPRYAAIELEECILDEAGNGVCLEPARPPTTIEHFVTQGFGSICCFQALDRFYRQAVD
jgi:hypothetical protein